MIDFNDIAQETVIARGQFSIVRSKREKTLAHLRDLCEQQNSAVAAVLRDLQGSMDVDRHFSFLRVGLEQMAEAVTEIEELNQQLALLSPMAFPQ